jgi:glutamate synthase (NADPH/NADH) large chain
MTGGLVVVLGEVGRNFAAGMSGGIAYVYDPRGELAARCNTASVALEALDVEPGFDPAEPMADMLRHDCERLRLLVERHQALTGSRRAAALLADWDAALPHFVKVMPIDYRAALERAQAVQTAEPAPLEAMAL